MQSQKRQDDLCSFPRQTIQYHSNPSLCPTSNAREAEVEWFYENLQDLLELTPQKRCPFHYRGLECKSRKSRDTWVTGKFGLGVQNEARQRLTEFCQENALVIANTLFQQNKRRLYTWTSPYGQYWNQINYILCSRRWRRSVSFSHSDMSNSLWPHGQQPTRLLHPWDFPGKSTGVECRCLLRSYLE